MLGVQPVKTGWIVFVYFPRDDKANTSCLPGVIHIKPRRGY